MSEHSAQDPTPPRVVARLPNGDFVDVFAHLEHQRQTEASMSTALLRSGDLVAMQYTRDDGTNGGLTFEVESANWHSLGVSGGWSPDTTLRGKLQGSEVPPEVADKEVLFTGCGWGGSTQQTGAIATGMSPYFNTGDGEYRAPLINNFEVFRRGDEGDLALLEPNQLATEMQKESMKHKRRLSQVQELMQLFGFDRYDIRDGSKTSVETGQTDGQESFDPGTLVYEDERYIANYEAGMAKGNQLAVYDKKNGQWTEFKYYNSRNQGVLQIAYADLSAHDPKQVFGTERLAEESGVHASGEAIVTYTTSSSYGLDIINYKVSKKQAAQMGIPEVIGHIPRPNFQISANGSVNIEATYLAQIEEAKPGLIKNLEANTHVTISEDGTTTLNIDGKETSLKNPEQELEKLLNYLKGVGSETEMRLRGRDRIKQLVGQYIRNSKPR